jgi:hypothetical protein
MTDMLDGVGPAARESEKTREGGRPRESEETGGSGISVASRLLLGGAAAMMVAAGLVLWSVRGPVIFTDMLSAAIAWCF